MMLLSIPVVMMILSIPEILSQSYSISVISGGNAGYLDSSGVFSQFDGPSGLAVDPYGRIVIADKDNNAIRAISVVEPYSSATLAGGGSAGLTNGIFSKFNSPSDICYSIHDAYYYIADSGNHVIRRFSGATYTFAGTGAAGRKDGSSQSARFNSPMGITVDAQGTIYVSDTGNSLIRKISADGQVSTIAGSGVASFRNGYGTRTGFNRPRGLTLDSSGKYLYVADTGNNLIRMIDMTGTVPVVTTIAGVLGISGDLDGKALDSHFDSPSGIFITEYGSIYITDTGNGVIRKISTNNTVSTLVLGDGSLISPYGIYVSNDVMYLSDQSTNQIFAVSVINETSQSITMFDSAIMTDILSQFTDYLTADISNFSTSVETTDFNSNFELTTDPSNFSVGNETTVYSLFQSNEITPTNLSSSFIKGEPTADSTINSASMVIMATSGLFSLSIINSQSTIGATTTTLPKFGSGTELQLVRGPLKLTSNQKLWSGEIEHIQDIFKISVDLDLSGLTSFNGHIFLIEINGSDIIQLYLEDKNGIYLTLSLADPSKLTKRQTAAFSGSLPVDKFDQAIKNVEIYIGSQEAELYLGSNSKTFQSNGLPSGPLNILTSHIGQDVVFATISNLTLSTTSDLLRFANPNSDNTTILTPAVKGIIVGSVIGAICLIATSIFIFRRFSRRTHEPSSEESQETTSLDPNDPNNDSINPASAPTARTEEDLISESAHRRSQQSRRTRRSNSECNRREYLPTAPELPTYSQDSQEPPPEYTSNLNLSRQDR